MISPDEARFRELLAQGRELTAEERREHFRRLAKSPYMAALLVEVREAWEQCAQDISEQKLVDHHNRMEHCAGSMHALKIFEGKLKTALRLPKPQGEQAPPE